LEKKIATKKNLEKMPLRRLYGDQLDQIGPAVGKELTKIDFTLIKEKVGCLQARFIKSFGHFELAMGVDTMAVSLIFYVFYTIFAYLMINHE